ncbi:Hsp20 family protein [Chelativorans salis]|uniref:Hsp20 family protein n=1 Tax=Chelativorans salis TaxID=2978478 RepID=A0ABT2LMC0_9HYPH|nr:Hsp20 family protein [Chelativorans sp. EGI FJ00035]MCT7374818.1 Hsp20 family protein [Chelativorans sp. EGI FJ00035]
MRTFDLSPLYRSSIGFDRILGLLENPARLQTVDNWPPYDIAKTGEDAYRISMAVAGFAQDELEIIQEPNLLVVSGVKAEDDKAEYLHRGIAGRSFTRRFELADHVKVVGAKLENGMLTIDLERDIPEEMKPRRIDVVTGKTPAASKQIEGKKQAA